MIRRTSLVCSALVLCFVAAAMAGQQPGISGSVLDPLGARVAGATVTLLREGQQAADARSGADGAYSFSDLAPGRYQVLARAAGFAPQTSDPVFVSGGRVNVDLTLQVSPLTQGVVVTASAGAVPQSQTGAPVTVIDEAVLNAINKLDVLEALRLVPGAQVHQNAGRGGNASLFIRGGNSNFAKILIDGMAANDIGGGFDFSQLATTGVSSVEVLRQANSVSYGADALAGVVNIETRRGRTRVPEVGYAIDGGTLGTFRNALSIGGAVKRLDYFSEYSYSTTDNDVENNDYTNKTYAGRFGVQLGSRTDLSGVIRRTDGEVGSPNAVSLFQIADDARQANEQTYVGATARSQWNNRLQTTIRFGESDQRLQFTNPAPTGEAYDPFGFGANYLGRQVTLSHPDGGRATGRAILDFGGVFPSVFRSRTARRALYGQASYALTSAVTLSAGGRVEREQGFSDPDAEPTTTRSNSGLFVEGRGALGGRAYLTVGLGRDDNESFDPVTTARGSLAVYLRTPASGVVGDTKLTFNAGNGIKAPAVFQVASSLETLLAGVPNAPSVGPIAPETGTSIDLGIEQGLWDGHARLRLAWFRNSYQDLIEFVSKTTLPQVGVPQAVAAATAFGAYVNSQSYEAQGLEASFEALVSSRLRVMASYTFLDAEVTESFSSGALAPAFNTAFPGIPIGAFSPLVGNRPFRRPAHSGTFMISYQPGRAQLTLSSYFSGARDGSTFLSDQFFGNSLLLPNQGLDEAYQKVDLSASYQVSGRVRPYLNVENLFDKDYEAAYGFPSLPRTARVGVFVRLGGD